MRRTTIIEFLDSLGQKRPIRDWIEQDIKTTAAGQSEIDFAGSPAVSYYGRPVAARNVRRQLCFETAVTHAPYTRTIGKNRQLGAKTTRETTIDSDDRAQSDAFSAGCLESDVIFVK
ncbi:hypothetical protein ED21_21659 [Erythrobacter sp. SD-21]|nr:hypothetical protein ED21_21659 [Erythrobacter sp. SD-21]